VSVKESDFLPDDEPDFVRFVTGLIGDGAARLRGLPESEYVGICRTKWLRCPVDPVFDAKSLLDDIITKFEPAEAEPYCVLLARGDPWGNLINVPEGYSIPEDGVRRIVIPIAYSPISDEEDSKAIETNLIAIFDVLGFESRLRHLGLRRVWTLYENVIDKAVVKQSRDAPFLLGYATSSEGRANGLLYRFPTRSAYFSDTILIWIPYRHPMMLEPFLIRCAAVFCAALREGLPLRGAITIGESILHGPSNTFLGAPLVEGARLEAAQNWIGISLGASFKKLTEFFPGEALAIYDAPKKDQTADLFLGAVLDWPLFWGERRDKTAIETLQELRTEEFARYYDNAIAFAQDLPARRERWRRFLQEKGMEVVQGFRQ
jgi:hypothetical protein